MHTRAFSCAWPAMLLAALLLLPFLGNPYTIDDPIYLREAQQMLTDPLHPQAIDLVWTADVKMRASRLQPGGVAAPYLLIPTVLAGNAEWVGHLTQILLLGISLWGVALVALRLGADRRQASAAALLAASAPAVIGMAGTVMPDIASMLYSTLGMERILAWREDRKWHQALAATVLLALDALTRGHTILILAAAFVFLLDGLHPEELRESFRVFPARFLPLVLTPLVFVAITLVTADPEPGTGIVVEQFFAGGVRMLATNLCAFFAHWSLAVPLVIPWLILRWRKLPWKLIALTLPVFGAASIWLGWIVYLVAASVAVFADILMESLRNRDRIQLGLWVWLLPALATIAYVHLPCKYLLPSVAAAVILVVRLLPASEARVGRWLIPAAVAAGAIVGLLILSGTRTLAEAQRSAVAELITPRLQQGEHVLFAGQWGFHWYAEEAGAEAASWLPPNVQPGDIVVISLADQPLFPQKWTRRRLIEERSFSKPGIRVMDRASGAGFFSCPWGYLPVTWSSDQTNQFEVWQIE